MQNSRTQETKIALTVGLVDVGSVPIVVRETFVNSVKPADSYAFCGDAEGLASCCSALVSRGVLSSFIEQMILCSQIFLDFVQASECGCMKLAPLFVMRHRLYILAQVPQVTREIKMDIIIM